jgi:hypothetical protein
MTYLLASLALLNIALLAFPLVAAIPYLRQAHWLLAAAHAAARSSRAVAGLSTGFALALALWTGVNWTSAAWLAVLMACVAASRVNTFEWIFPAAARVDAVPVSRFGDIADGDMVIGVVLAGAARAYPVRYLAHHHMVNDELGGTAILPTY